MFLSLAKRKYLDTKLICKHACNHLLPFHEALTLQMANPFRAFSCGTALLMQLHWLAVELN